MVVLSSNHTNLDYPQQDRVCYPYALRACKVMVALVASMVEEAVGGPRTALPFQVEKKLTATW